jgi:hypothetical protein
MSVAIQVIAPATEPTTVLMSVSRLRMWASREGVRGVGLDQVDARLRQAGHRREVANHAMQFRGFGFGNLAGAGHPQRQLVREPEHDAVHHERHHEEDRRATNSTDVAANNDEQARQRRQ